MKLLILGLMVSILTGCMTVPVSITGCDKGSGPIAVNINLDKAVSTLPIDAKARDVTVPMIP